MKECKHEYTQHVHLSMIITFTYDRFGSILVFEAANGLCVRIFFQPVDAFFTFVRAQEVPCDTNIKTVKRISLYSYRTGFESLCS